MGAEGDGLEGVGEVDGGAEDAVVNFDKCRELVPNEVLEGRTCRLKYY